MRAADRAAIPSSAESDVAILPGSHHVAGDTIRTYFVARDRYQNVIECAHDVANLATNYQIAVTGTPPCAFSFRRLSLCLSLSHFALFGCEFSSRAGVPHFAAAD